jgi:hypothetical protein
MQNTVAERRMPGGPRRKFLGPEIVGLQKKEWIGQESLKCEGRING